jgi:hypothetical protein
MRRREFIAAPRYSRGLFSWLLKLGFKHTSYASTSVLLQCSLVFNEYIARLYSVLIQHGRALIEAVHAAP